MFCPTVVAPRPSAGTAIGTASRFAAMIAVIALITLITLSIMVALTILLSGCTSQAPEESGAEAADPQRLVFLFQRQKDPEQTRENARHAAAFLTERLGIEVEAVVPGDYAASVQALVSGQADVAYVSALPFLLARRDADARLVVAEVREDASGTPRTSYDSVWVVRDDSPLKTWQDVLAQRSDLRVCFTSRTSTSGFVMAMLRLVRDGAAEPGANPATLFRSATFGGSYTQALQEVLAGRADLCAVSFYTVEGAAADTYTTAAERAQLRIIARTPEVPTHLVCVRGGISPALEARIRTALLALSDERPDLLENVYGAARFAEVDADDHVRAAVDAMQAVGLPIEGFVK